MKKMWISALLAAAMMTAAGAADTPSAWAQKSVDAARAAGIVPAQVNSAFDTAITREDFCSLAATARGRKKTRSPHTRAAASAFRIRITRMCCSAPRQAW